MSNAKLPAPTDEQKCALCERTLGQHYGANAYCTKSQFSERFTPKPLQVEGPIPPACDHCDDTGKEPGYNLPCEKCGVKAGAEATGKPENELIRDWLKSFGYMVPGDAQFDKDWNALMPVVEKIEGMGYKTVASQGFDGKSQYINIMTNVEFAAQTLENPSKFMGKEMTKIAAWYSAVVQWIKWFNSNKKA